MPIRTKARHQEITLLGSIDTMQTIPERLFEITIQGVKEASRVDLEFLDDRMLEKKSHPEIEPLLINGCSAQIWPGEHYRLLAGIARAINAKNIIEIGTYWGAGALALKSALDNVGKVTTFDIVKWEDFTATMFHPEDFDQQLEQIIGDLQDENFFRTHQKLFEEADLIFLDAAKDGIMERSFLASFAKCNFKNQPILLIDDIHLWNMLDIWEDISQPKLDITCFGHYTGTGLVDLS